jgi:hypothetical protein
VSARSNARATRILPPIAVVNASASLGPAIAPAILTALLVADQARPRVPKLAKLMDEAEADVLAYMGFPAQHRAKIHSTDALDKPRVAGGALPCRPYADGIFGSLFGLRDCPAGGFSDQALTNRV